MKFLLVLVFVAGSVLGPVTRALATPYLPTDDTEVLERLPYRVADPRVRELRRLRAEQTREPGNLDLAISLARRYIEQGRANWDPRYYGYAQAALRAWWDLPQPPPEVLVLRAILRQNRHDFTGALADLAQVLAVQPRNPQAWLTQAVVLQVQGDYGGALRSCWALLRLAPELPAATCIGSALSLSGQARQGYALLSQVLEENPLAGLEVRRWASTTLAEIAVRIGRHADAEQRFKEALALGERDTYLLGSYADFLLDQDRAEEVTALLQNENRVDGLLLRLALAEQRLRSGELASHVDSLRARFAASRARGDSIHQADEARFTLHLLADPQTALSLALANWEVQREPRDARIVLEAALAAREPAAAKPVLDMLEHTSLEDARLAALAARLKSVRK
ncbi:MAG: tetratricopeptide repeat protein [Gammaproteobacteria bacterium]